MPIDADEAAKIAKERGLSLSDARALSVLADDADHATKLADQFRPEPDEAADARKIADRIDRGSL